VLAEVAQRLNTAYVEIVANGIVQQAITFGEQLKRTKDFEVG
jgi:hypothetical protein